MPEVEDVDEALEKGDLKFTLHGKKLKGSWVLVRTGGRFGGASGRPSWLLIKHRDSFASQKDVTIEQPRSASTNRSLAEIAQAAGGDVAKAAAGDGLDGEKAGSPQIAGSKTPASNAREEEIEATSGTFFRSFGFSMNRERGSPARSHPIPRSAHARKTGPQAF